MSHLSQDELLEAAEGRAGRREHVEACPSCRTKVDELVAVLREAAAVEVPEPSPLFWRHFSARVSEAVRQQNRVGDGELEEVRAQGRRAALARWGRTGLRLLAPALAVLILAVVVRSMWQPAPSESTAKRAAAVDVPTLAPVDDAAADEEAWGVFSVLASEADATGASLEPAAPGVADVAVLQLTDDERGELIRLLKAELERGWRGES
jgi:hypothetical protein